MTMLGSTWEGSLISTSAAAKQSKVALLGPCADQASLEALRAEVIRVALWIQSASRQTASFSDAAVTTRNLLELARTLWTPIQDAAATDTTQHGNGKQESESESNVALEMSRDLLDDLTEQGDLHSLGEGRWLPAPPRLVPLASTRCLLIGGVPTHLLPDELLQALHLHGSFRHVDGSAISALNRDPEQGLQWRFQSLESWLGPSPSTLDDLVGSFDEQELYPVAHQIVSDTSLEAYAASVDKPQHVRWQSLDYITDGHYLLRNRTPWGVRQYTIGHISNHRLTKQSHVMHQIDIRRLCYALDRKAGKPTSVQWNAMRGEFIFNSELPGRERKLLSSLGFLQENKDSYYPRRWINVQHCDTILSRLVDLGIRIEAI